MAGGVLREIVTLFGLDVDKGSFKSAEAKVDQLRKGVLNLARAFAGGVVVNELRKIVSETVEMGDKIAKTSASLGIETDALQELRYAGDLSGVSIEKMDAALGRFVKGTAEAAAGTGEAKDALYEMGIRLRDSTGKLRSADDMLGDVADKMAGFASEGDRARMAAKLFGRESGQAMVNALRGGSKALAEMRAEARALGGVLDTDLIAMSEELNDEQGRVAFVLRGLKNDIAKGLIPTLIASAKATVAWVRENRELISDTLLRGLKALMILVDAGARLLWAAVRGADALGEALGGTAKGVAIAAVVFAALALAMGLPVAIAVALALALEDVAGYFEGRDSVTGKIVDFIDLIRKTPLEADDWWLIRYLKYAIELFDQVRERPKGLARDFVEWLGFDLPRFSDPNAGEAMQRKAEELSMTAPLPARLSGGPEYAPNFSSGPVTINQTINAAPGQDAAAVGAAAGKSAGDVVGEQNRRALRSLVPQAAGSF